MAGLREIPCSHFVVAGDLSDLLGLGAWVARAGRRSTVSGLKHEMYQNMAMTIEKVDLSFHSSTPTRQFTYHFRPIEAHVRHQNG